MKTTISERRDYEIYIKLEVSQMTISNKQKAIVRKIAMECFDDGVAFLNQGLEVET